MPPKGTDSGGTRGLLEIRYAILPKTIISGCSSRNIAVERSPEACHHTTGVLLALNRRYFLQLATATALLPAAAIAVPRRTVALLFDSLVSPFWIAAREALRTKIEAQGWSVLEAVSNMDDTRQYTQVQSMIQRGVDGIVIVHTDAKAVIPAIRAANAAGIPMVHFNRAPAESDAYSVAVVADNRRLMDETVTTLIKELPLRDAPYRAAILIGDLGDANGASRRDGFADAVTRFPERIDVVARIATEWNADKAFTGLSKRAQGTSRH